MFIENFKDVVNGRYVYDYEKDAVYDTHKMVFIPQTSNGVKLLKNDGKYTTTRMDIIKNFFDANEYIEKAIKDGYKLINYPHNINYYINEKGTIFQCNKRNFKIKEYIGETSIHLHTDTSVRTCGTLIFRVSNLVNRTFIYPKLKRDGYIELKDFKNIKNGLYLVNEEGMVYSTADHCFKVCRRNPDFMNLINTEGVYSTMKIGDLVYYYFINKGVEENE